MYFRKKSFKSAYLKCMSIKFKWVYNRWTFVEDFWIIQKKQKRHQYRSIMFFNQTYSYSKCCM
jgi:hypothetical protein